MILPELLQKCKIQTSVEDLKKFSIDLTRFPEGCSLSDYLFLLYAWYKTCHSTQGLRVNLMQTIRDFEEINSKSLGIQEKNLVETLLVVLKMKLQEMPIHDLDEETFEDRCINNLHKIFNFYSKQQLLAGKTFSFDSIKTNGEVLTIGKFINFCRDFKVLSHDKTQAKKSLKTIKNAFTQSSESGKHMYEHQFIQALTQISKKFFDKDYDKIHSTDWKSLTIAEKRVKFFEFLECDDPHIYTKKFKEPLSNFGSDPYDRIPDYDLGKKFKLRPQKLKQMKASIQEWKVKKRLEKIQEYETPIYKIESGISDEESSENTKSLIEKPKKVNWDELEKMALQETISRGSDSENQFQGRPLIYSPQYLPGKINLPKSISAQKFVKESPEIFRKKY